jgi:hypothetical protein
MPYFQFADKLLSAETPPFYQLYGMLPVGVHCLHQPYFCSTRPTQLPYLHRRQLAISPTRTDTVSCMAAKAAVPLRCCKSTNTLQCNNKSAGEYMVQPVVPLVFPVQSTVGWLTRQYCFCSLELGDALPTYPNTYIPMRHAAPMVYGCVVLGGLR